jgi:hypothetical protein
MHPIDRFTGQRERDTGPIQLRAELLDRATFSIQRLAQRPPVTPVPVLMLTVGRTHGQQAYGRCGPTTDTHRATGRTQAANQHKTLALNSEYSEHDQLIAALGLAVAVPRRLRAGRRPLRGRRRVGHRRRHGRCPEYPSAGRIDAKRCWGVRLRFPPRAVFGCRVSIRRTTRRVRGSSSSSRRRSSPKRSSGTRWAPVLPACVADTAVKVHAVVAVPGSMAAYARGLSLPVEDGLGLAIANRLRRAAGPRPTK